MVPCYNPNEAHLAETLRSILVQDPGSAEMQVELIDDCSPKPVTERFVTELAGNRVQLHRSPRNLGLAGVWNLCIERARGEWVHILHQDDLVMPGFYSKFRRAAESGAKPGLIYCRHRFIDTSGHAVGISDLDRDSPGCIEAGLPFFAAVQRIQTPAVAVRRAIYEHVGGFRSDLCYALDWEMWCRVARDSPVWFEPEALAHYRLHPANASSRLMLEGRDIEDIRRCIELISSYISNHSVASKTERHARHFYSLYALNNAGFLLSQGHANAALRQIRGALACDISVSAVKRLVKMTPPLLWRLARRTTSAAEQHRAESRRST
jgi:GT2 family glycosyltransferase